MKDRKNDDPGESEVVIFDSDSSLATACGPQATAASLAGPGGPGPGLCERPGQLISPVPRPAPPRPQIPFLPSPRSDSVRTRCARLRHFLYFLLSFRTLLKISDVYVLVLEVCTSSLTQLVATRDIAQIHQILALIRSRSDI